MHVIQKSRVPLFLYIKLSSNVYPLTFFSSGEFNRLNMQTCRTETFSHIKRRDVLFLIYIWYHFWERIFLINTHELQF